MKKRITPIILLALIFVLIITCVHIMSSPAHAAESYATVQAGWLHTQNSNYGDSAGFNGRVETPIYGDLNIAGEVGYHGAQSHGEVGSIFGYSLLAELIYYPSFGWKVKPYLLAGAGWSWWDIDKGSYLSENSLNVELGDSFAEKFGVGADYTLGKGWFLNIEWYWFGSHIPKNSYSMIDGSPANILGDDNRSGKVTLGQEETAFIVGLKKNF